MTSPQPDTPATTAQAATGGTSRPEPVRNAAAAASLLTTLAGLVLLVLVFAHVITPDGQAVLGPALATAIPTAVGAVSTIVAALRARQQVTPLSAPVSAAGVALVEATGDVMAAVRQLRGLPSQATPGPDHSAG